MIRVYEVGDSPVFRNIAVTEKQSGDKGSRYDPALSRASSPCGEGRGGFRKIKPECDWGVRLEAGILVRRCRVPTPQGRCLHGQVLDLLLKTTVTV